MTAPSKKAPLIVTNIPIAPICFNTKAKLEDYKTDLLRIWFKHYSKLRGDSILNWKATLDFKEAETLYTKLAASATKRPLQSKSELTTLQARVATLTKLLAASNLVVDEYLAELDRTNTQLEEATSRLASLQDFIDYNTDCLCDDWQSIGTDPTTGDKLKRCNICKQIGVR